MPTVSSQQEKTAQLVWTSFILMFFVVQAVVWAVAITITASDTSHAVVDGYEAQALNWDEVKRERRQSELLGWQTKFTVVKDSGLGSRRLLSLNLTDKSNKPISGASINLRVFHRGTAADVQDLRLTEQRNGTYAAEFVAEKSGKWCITGTAIEANQKFLINDMIKFKSN